MVAYPTASFIHFLHPSRDLDLGPKALPGQASGLLAQDLVSKATATLLPRAPPPPPPPWPIGTGCTQLLGLHANWGRALYHLGQTGEAETLWAPQEPCRSQVTHPSCVQGCE